MTTVNLLPSKSTWPASVSASLEKPMYAIALDMDIESLKENYGDPYNNAYIEIRKVLQRHGFNWQQGSVYFGGENINAVTCVMAAIDLAKQLPWFSVCSRYSNAAHRGIERPDAGDSAESRLISYR